MTQVPWHVGIYKNREQICGGTIITERVVVTAAHCFSMAIDYIHVIDVKSFQVAAGKTWRSLDELESPAAQIRDVEEIKIHES